jgi:hypothetical protein
MSLGTLWQRLNDPRRQAEPAASAVEAFQLVVRQNDPAKLKAWVATRSEHEKEFFESLLVAQ